MSKKTREDKSSAVVIISVRGGVADLIFKPAGMAVIVVDYDIDGTEKITEDPDGKRCVIGRWSSDRKVVSNEHWPIVQQANTDITCCCTRQWKCSSCGQVIECSYEQIVEIGTPHCPRCEIEMTMA